MGEGGVDVETPIRKDVHEKPLEDGYKLPTNLELAKDGVRELVTLLPKLSPKAQELFRTRKEILRCFTGISPEVRFEEISEKTDSFTPSGLEYFRTHLKESQLPREALIEAQQVIDDFSPNFHIFHFPKQGEHKKEIFQMVNIEAVAQVIHNYPTYFPPEARTHTREWVIELHDIWSQDLIQYGLLSGFPLDAVLKYTKGAKDGHGVESDLNHVGYRGYDISNDNEYIKKLDDIYLQSNIEEEAKLKSGYHR